MFCSNSMTSSHTIKLQQQAILHCTDAHALDAGHLRMCVGDRARLLRLQRRHRLGQVV